MQSPTSEFLAFVDSRLFCSSSGAIPVRKFLDQFSYTVRYHHLQLEETFEAAAGTVF